LLSAELFTVSSTELQPYINVIKSIVVNMVDLMSDTMPANVLRTAAGRFHRTLIVKMSLCHREFKINHANVQQFLCAIARLNVYHVCMGGAALSRLAAVRC